MKTPIQELISLVNTSDDEWLWRSDVIAWIQNYGTEKEKQFAKECYEQGRCEWDSTDDNSFEKFYSKYVE